MERIPESLAHLSIEQLEKLKNDASWLTVCHMGGSVQNIPEATRQAQIAFDAAAELDYRYFGEEIR